MQAPQTALIVAVPEAEPAVARHRLRLDPSAAWGVPAHVTVLFPFVALEGLDTSPVRAVAAATPGFYVTFRRVGWFGETVVWLEPEPGEPFRRLTAEICAYFPGVQPYGGRFDEVIPHLTIGEGQPIADLRAAAAEVERDLPIHARATSLRLITRGPGARWVTVEEFPLG